MRKDTAWPGSTRALTISPDWRYLVRHPARLIAFGFGAGLSPFAPGTVGTLVGFPVFGLLVQMRPSAVAFFAALALLFAVGVWAAARVGRETGVVDYGGIVWDEVVAFVAILYFTPPTLAWYGAAFFIFRLFDVWKPFPIRYFDTHIKNGFGVMFDDVLAAVYSVITLKLLVWAIHG